MEIEKILIVDDEEGIRKLMKVYCRGYIVKTAENGKIGLELTAQRNYDIIFSDHFMPVMGGLEFRKELLKKKYITKFVLMSGAEILEKTKREYKLYGCLMKPFTRKEFYGYFK